MHLLIEDISIWTEFHINVILSCSIILMISQHWIRWHGIRYGLWFSITLAKITWYIETVSLYPAFIFNSLWPSDAYGDTDLDQHWFRVMACCLMAPSHYPEPMLIWRKFYRECSRYLSLIWVWEVLIKISTTSPKGPWVKLMLKRSWLRSHEITWHITFGMQQATSKK